MLDKAIRRNLEKGDEWFKEFRATGKGDEYVDNWVKAIGKEKFLENWDTIYAMHHNEELLSQTFGSPKVVDLLKRTNMPKNVKQTVLDYFSNAWNTLFHGGKPETVNALSQMLTSFDEYLGGGHNRSYKGRDYLRDSLIATGVRPEALANRIVTTQKLFATGDLSHSIEGFKAEGDRGILPASAEYERATQAALKYPDGQIVT